MENEGSGQARLDNIGNKTGNLTHGLPAECHGEEDSEHREGGHRVIVDENASEIEGECVHKEDDRLRKREDGPINVGLFQICPIGFIQVVKVLFVEDHLLVEALHGSNIFNCFTRNFARLFQEFGVTHCFAKLK